MPITHNMSYTFPVSLPELKLVYHISDPKLLKINSR